MPTLTSNYSLYKPLVNNATDQDLWGGYLNDDMDDIDGLLRAGITIATEASQTAAFNIDASINVKLLYPCDATGGGFSGTLPSASTAGNGATVFIKKTDASANIVTVTRDGSDTIDGATSVTLDNQYDIIGLASDGVSSWSVVSTTGSFTGDTGTGGKPGLVPAPAAGDGAANKFLNAGGSWRETLVPSTAQSASGAALDFTSIPSWVNRIQVSMAAVSTTGSDSFLVQIGDSGGIESSGYISASGKAGGNALQVSSTSGFIVGNIGAGYIHQGIVTIIRVSGDQWAESHAISDTLDGYPFAGGGYKSLSGTLDRLRFTTTGGSNSFDIGTINILYD